MQEEIKQEQALQEQLHQLIDELESATQDILQQSPRLNRPSQRREISEPTPNITLGFMMAPNVSYADVRKCQIEREEGESYKIAINRIDKLMEHLEEEKKRMQQELSNSKTPFLLSYIPDTYHTQKGAIVKQLEQAFEGKHYQQLANKIIDLCRAGKMRWPIALASRAEQPLSECVTYDERFFEQFVNNIPQKYQVNYSSFQKAMARATELY